MPKRKEHLIDIVAVAALGGAARKAALSPARRSEIAKQAAVARWGKKKLARTAERKASK